MPDDPCDRHLLGMKEVLTGQPFSQLSMVERLEFHKKAYATEMGSLGGFKDEVQHANDIASSKLHLRVSEVPLAHAFKAAPGRRQNTTTWRMASPVASRSKPSLISSSVILCVISFSIGSLPACIIAAKRGMSRTGTQEPT